MTKKIRLTVSQFFLIGNWRCLQFCSSFYGHVELDAKSFPKWLKMAKNGYLASHCSLKE